MISIVKYISLIFLIGAFIACKQTPEIRFLEPQPINKRDLKVIPKHYRGKYLSKTDSSLLTIDSKIIFQEWYGLSSVSDSEMHEVFDTVYKNDTILELFDGWKIKIYVDDLGDSSSIETFRTDTIFELNSINKLRTFKGYLFLNYKRQDSTWRVKTLCLEKEQLDFNDLISEVQIDTLREITNIVTVIDTASNFIDHHDLNPSRAELKEILNRRYSEIGYSKIK